MVRIEGQDISSLDDDALEGGAVNLIGPYVDSINIDFYDGLYWQDGWDQFEEQFPEAVRIAITVIDEDGRENPVRLQTTIPVLTRNDNETLL